MNIAGFRSLTDRYHTKRRRGKQGGQVRSPLDRKVTAILHSAINILFSNKAYSCTVQYSRKIIFVSAESSEKEYLSGSGCVFEMMAMQRSVASNNSKPECVKHCHSM